MDKSAFQALSAREHRERLFRFVENIPPVLVREILADLAKTTAKGLSGDALVAMLATKFLGSGGPVNADYRSLCLASLDGQGVPMTGQVICDEYKVDTMPDGSTAVVVDPADANLNLLRWAQGAFTAGERDVAEALRRHARGLSREALRGRLRKHGVLIPRANTVTDVRDIATDLLGRGSLQGPILDWLLEQLHVSAPVAAAVLHRWELAGRPFLASFAAYAHHCAWVLLLLLVGMTHKVFTARPTNRVDAEYLFYAPFCEVFASGDGLHKQLAPFVLRDDQHFLWKDELKADLKRLADERDALTAHEIAQRDFAFGSRPWPARDSVLWQLWEKLRGPWKAGQGNRAALRSQDERDAAIELARRLVRDAGGIDRG